MVQKTLFPKKITREELNSLVDKAADIIRTATDYKFILVLLFLKRMSDTWKEEFEEKKKEFMQYLNEEAAEKEAENEVYHTFNLRRDLLWDEITKDVKKLPENLSNALIEIAKLNKELDGVINKFSFLGFTTQEHREKLRQLVELFNQYNLGNKFVSSDIVGDAYEHILYRFAPTQAKQGEVYTPREVIQLLVEILDPKPGGTIFCIGLLKPGDILFNNTNSADLIGKTAIFRGEFSRCVYSNHLTRIRVNPNKVLPEWILYIFIRNWRRGIFRAIRHQHVHQAGINKADLLNLKIPIAPLKEQRSITKMLLSVDKKLRIETKEKKKLERIKQALMNLLLTGKIRVKVA